MAGDAQHNVMEVLQEKAPLPESVLWKLQDSFYDKVNIKAWANAIVPNFVTSNCFIANCYARNIVGYVRDWFLRCVTGHCQLTFAPFLTSTSLPSFLGCQV